MFNHSAFIDTTLKIMKCAMESLINMIKRGKFLFCLIAHIAPSLENYFICRLPGHVTIWVLFCFQVNGKLHLQQPHTTAGRVKCFKGFYLPSFLLLLFLLSVYNGCQFRDCFSDFQGQEPSPAYVSAFLQPDIQWHHWKH